MILGLSSIAAIAATGLVASATSVAVLPWPVSAFAVTLAVLCTIVTAVDLDRFIIPDTANLALLVSGVAETIARLPSATLAAGLLEIAARCVAAGGVLWLTRHVYVRITGRDGLGLGDVKLAAAAGSWLDWPSLPVALQLAVVIALMAIAVMAAHARRMPDRHAELPFGACLAPAIWAAFVLERL